MKLMVWLKNQDQLVLYYMNLRIKCLFLDWIMKWITHLGGATFTIGLSLSLMLMENIRLEGCIALVASHLLVQLLKRGFTRCRPYIADQNIWVSPNSLQDFSFPSGHTTAIFSIITSISIAVPWTAVLLFPIACMVGISRVYLGLHYPTDVGVGAVIGLIFASGVHVASLSNF